MPLPKRVLDLFCGAGGAAMGLHRAWPEAEIVGVDIKPQPRYPFKFIQADAMEFPLERFDFIWASPPCQAYSVGSARWRKNGSRKYPDLIAPTRQRFKALGVNYCIENVQGAKKFLIEPFQLCGQMFGLGVVRHRLFEANFFVLQPAHPNCFGAVIRAVAVGVYGGAETFSYSAKHRRDYLSVSGHGPPGRFYRAVTVAGHGGNSSTFRLQAWKDAMGIDWMTRDELTQSGPPAYSEFIARQVPFAAAS